WPSSLNRTTDREKSRAENIGLPPRSLGQQQGQGLVWCLHQVVDVSNRTGAQKYPGLRLVGDQRCYTGGSQRCRVDAINRADSDRGKPGLWRPIVTGWACRWRRAGRLLLAVWHASDDYQWLECPPQNRRFHRALRVHGRALYRQL